MSNRGKIAVKKDLLEPGIGVKIKQEPGIEISSQHVPTSGTAIKQEPGVGVLKSSPQSSPGRLSSFKLPRDLTLGGQNVRRLPKKVYTPNLNAVRVKKDPSAIQEFERGPSTRGRGRGARAHNERGRGRGRHNSNLIQSAGIFSEGSAEALRRGSSGSSSNLLRDDSTSLLQKPTINLKKELRVDKEEEQEQLRILMGDSEEPTNDVDINLETVPTVLPSIEQDKIFKCKTEKSENDSLKKKIKEEPGIVIKSEVLDYEGDSVPDQKMDFMNGLSKVKEEMNEKLSCDTLQGLLSSKQSPFFLLQLPDTLPGQGSEVAPDTKNGDQKDSSDKLDGKCLLKDVDSGRIGKIIMYKSGKTKLLLGETLFDLNMGTQSSFLQELISIEVNPAQRSGNMFNLGPIQSKILAIPDWDVLVKNVNKK